jgi:hypothetical protein
VPSQAYATDSPTITPTTSFQPASVSSWNSFSATEIPNGGSIRYQLSDNDGVTWYYYDSSGTPGWKPAVTATNYNDAATVNTQISSFPVASGKIRVRAFLISNGTQQVKLDAITIGYTGNGGVNNGTFVSGSMDAGANVAFNRLVWSETNTANTTTRFQVATNTDNSTWNYVGPDGTSATYFTAGVGTIPLTISNGRYIRYTISFSSSTSDLPNVADVSVNYAP